MALIKHLKIYNKNYFDALDYLLFQHNELTGKPILDAQNNKIMREEYYLDGINCEPYSFSAECEALNRYYGKNNKPGEIKEHHFIISYDPKDAQECGLTGQQAQELSMEWARKCLPGFQVLVCTHMDGHNESGNIHTHLICNSVRKYEIGEDMYAERNGDRKAGNKLHLTLEYLEYMKREVMTICRREGLHQVDLLSPAEERKSDREYYAELRGKQKTEELINELEQSGIKPRKTQFQTEKDYLRRAIRESVVSSNTFKEFQGVLYDEYKVRIKESRGRWSYLHPNRQKYITGRALGASYEKEALLEIMQSLNKKWNYAEQEEHDEEILMPRTYKLETEEECKAVFFIHSELKLVVDLQAYAKAQSSVAYANKVKLSNLQKMAETILFVQQNGFDSIEELEETLEETSKLEKDVDKEIRAIKMQQRNLNEQIRYMGQYLSTKDIYSDFLQSKNKRVFMERNRDSLARYTKAKQYLKGIYSEERFPSINQLREEKKRGEKALRQLLDRKTSINNNRNAFSIAIKNIEEIFKQNDLYKDFNKQRIDLREVER